MTAHYPLNQSTAQSPLALRSARSTHAILWSLLGLLTFGVGWACLATIEESVQAVGKLTPQGDVKEVQVPVSGVIQSVDVQEGQFVQAGDRLLRLDPANAQSQLASLQTIRDLLQQEIAFYRAQLNGAESSALMLPSMSPAIAALTRNRAVLVDENQLYRAQLQGETTGMTLSSDQQLRWKTRQAEQRSRITAAQLEVEKLQQQLAQTQAKLNSAQDILTMNQQIYHKFQTVADAGGISQVQFLKQAQEVRTRQAEVEQLQQERARLQVEIEQAQARVQTTFATSSQDLLNQIAVNDKRIAEIDSQLNKAILENEKKLTQINSQINQVQQTLKYQELRAPVTGTVFDLKAKSTGYVAKPTEVVLKVVPQEGLVAEISITNKDIGFVKVGMPVDVRIDSYPFSEFGDLKGRLVAIGSDALPPDATHPTYRFPAKVQLEQQVLSTRGQTLKLRPGMAVSANIRIRERRVISIFTDSFTQNIDGLRFVR